jgi:hypothetical protein
MLIYDAYQKYLESKRDEQNRQYAETKRGIVVDRGSLWPTDVGQACHRKAIIRASGGRGADTFTTAGLDYMNAGSVYEAETANILRHVYGDALTEQIILKYKMWSGKADFGLHIGTDHPIIIEHKVTSEKNWDTDAYTPLPKHEHIGQAMTYHWLYEMLYGVQPQIILFYKAWGNFAEFDLSLQDGGKILVQSSVNGVIGVEIREYDVRKEIADLMREYDANGLPPRLEKKQHGCTFMGKPSCQYYKLCWGEDEDA